MKTIKYIGIIVLASTLVSCKKETYNVYSDVARIQFGPVPALLYTSSARLADTLKASTFFYDAADIKEDTVFFDIYTIGKVSQQDRSFTLEQEQVPSVNNAMAGVHYVPFGAERLSKLYTIKAGTAHARVPVILLRDASLKNITAVLKFKVVNNDNFKVGELSNLWRKVTITDRLSKPRLWDSGKYSLVKHKFMIDVTGQRWDDDFFANTESGLISYYYDEIKIALIEYNKAHPNDPLTDEDGELVEFL